MRPSGIDPLRHSRSRSSRSARFCPRIEPLDARRLLSFVPVVTKAYETPTPITLNGRLNEPAWATAAPVQYFYLFNGGGKSATFGKVTAKILWDAQYLYYGVTVYDSHIDSAGLGHDGALYKGDNAELFLKPASGSSPLYEFEFSPNGDTFDALFATRGADLATSAKWESGVKVATYVNGTDGNDSDTDTSWTLEAAIPRSALPAFAVGTDWSFLAGSYDYEPGQPSPLIKSNSPGDMST